MFSYRTIYLHTLLSMPALEEKQITPLAVLAMILMLSGYCAYRGLDFGNQWDEWTLLIPIKNFIEKGIFFPGYYFYPSFCYELALLSLLIRIPFFLLNGIAVSATFGEQLRTLVGSTDFVLETRFLFALLSLLTALWVFMLIRVSRKNDIEALIAAALIAFSWEISYHARWLVPNTIMMQWASFFLLLIYQANKITQRSFLWLALSSACAGVAAGTKYQCVLLMLPVYLVCLRLYLKTPEVASKRKVWLMLPLLLVIFLASFFVTTPGVVFDFAAFKRDVGEVASVYGSQHIGYTVAAGSEHFALIGQYLCLQLFSHYQMISFFFSLLMLVGTIDLLKNRWDAVVFLSFPIVYIVFCTISLNVMIVRNFLVVAPFLSVLAARGFTVLRLALRNYPIVSRFYCIAVVCMILANAIWLVHSALSISNRSQANYVLELSNYIDAHPENTFAVSALVRDQLAGNARTHMNISDLQSETAQFAVFFPKEILESSWLANRYHYTEQVFGPLDINFDYYPTWCNDLDRRIVVLERRKFASLVVSSPQ